MKRITILFTAALVLAGCSNDVTSPTDVESLFDSSGILSYDAAGLSGPGRYLAALHRLPDNLKLTAAQAAAIDAALKEFAAATEADRQALAALDKAAREARAAGKSADEIRQILAQGAAARERIAAAEQALQAKIESILTAEQKAWLDGNQRRGCDPRTAPPLTDQQRTQISTLIAAYEVNNKADLDAVKAAYEKARVAAQNKASREEIKAILDAVKPAFDRLAAAQVALLQAILDLLTPEQRASGCYRGTVLPPPVKTGR